jgi:hypothetical protein
MPAGITHDIELNGYGYNLLYKKGASAVNYTKYTDKAPTAGLDVVARTDDFGALLDYQEAITGSPDAVAAPSRRIVWDNFQGGAGRSFLSEGNSPGQSGEFGGPVCELIGLRPVLGGQGLMLAPAEQNYAIEPATNATELAAILFNGDLYVIRNTQVYSVDADLAGNFIGLTLLAGTLPYNVVSVGYSSNGQAWVCCGPDAVCVDNPAVAYSHAADYIAGYSGLDFLGVGNEIQWNDPSLGWKSFNFGSAVTALCNHEGALMIGTQTGVWRMVGQVVPVVVGGVITYQYDYTISKIVSCSEGPLTYLRGNFRSLTSFNGSLWGCMNGRLVRVHGTPTFNYAVEVQRVPRGWVWSICASVGCLFVAIQQVSESGGSTVWAYDPSISTVLPGGGWWRISPFLITSTIRCIFSGAGTTLKDSLLMGLHSTTNRLTRWSFSEVNASGLDKTNFGKPWLDTSGTLTLPFISPEDLIRLSGVNHTRPHLVQILRCGIEWMHFNTQDGWFDWPTPDAAVGTQSYSCYIQNEPGQDEAWVQLTNVNGVADYLPTARNIRAGSTDWVVPKSLGLVKPTAQYNPTRGTPIPSGYEQEGFGWFIFFYVYGPLSAMVRRVWIDYKLVEIKPQLGRYWKLSLDLNNDPEAVGLDGVPDVTTAAIGSGEPATDSAHVKAFRLWKLYQNGTRFDFKDLQGEGPYKVQIVNIKQEQGALGALPQVPSNVILHLELAEIIQNGDMEFVL